ncbi:flagellar motor switch phosphatase FliY [Oceanobacillus halotolerans]|uniref:flagellar motor switch phosphatase FliY n=1 Tax=Oceanobacillus halotolerans TaxID=2663380 RepID=UPI0013DA79D6|nr:flagellar motor switch phosphatase FliY [Oceanobacillus halotolerans]
MNDDGMLSQDEIDALLKGNEEEVETPNNKEKVEDYLSTIEIDTLGEIGNISFGSSATTLSTLLNQKVDITTPEVTVIKLEEAKEALNFDHITIQVDYIEGFSGQNVLIMKTEDATIISDIMLGGDGTNPDETLNEIHISAVQEAMNQMMGAAATSMSTVFSKRVDISPPTIEEIDLDRKDEAPLDDDPLVKVSFRLKIGNLIDSNIMQLIPVQFAKELAGQLLNPTELTESTQDQTQPEMDFANIAKEEAAVTMEQPVKDTAQPEPAVASTSMANQPQATNAQPQFLGNQLNQNNAQIQQATFSNFEQEALNKNEQRNLDMLMDIPLKVTVELGRTKRTVKDILDLTSGSIIELDKLAGEPVDILVNDKLVAKGEVVVIDENFGVRVSDILSQSERLMKLK